jgi:hypothetical protein
MAVPAASTSTPQREGDADWPALADAGETNERVRRKAKASPPRPRQESRPDMPTLIGRWARTSQRCPSNVDG